ncbi:GGDEF domain-containing protein [Candidatus Woesearchaeota archaeon]|nr:GGDEF domain-containing protein [Candidatus Woesearchaeota archaeon]
MDEKELEEIRNYISLMEQFAKRQESLIKGIEQRFNTLYEHRKMAAKIILNAREIISHFDLNKKDRMVQDAIAMKKFVMQSFEPLINEEIRLMDENWHIMLQENPYALRQQRIFASNYLRLKRDFSEGMIKNTEAGKQIKKELDELKRILKKQNERADIYSFLKNIIRKSQQYSAAIKVAVLRELEVLDKFVFREKYLPDKEGLKDSANKLSKLVDKLTKLLRQEKRDVIDPLKSTLHDKRDMNEAVANSIVKQGAKITIHMIKDDLRRLTTKPEEVRLYAKKMLRNQDYFYPEEMKGKIGDYLERVDEWARIEEKREGGTIDETLTYLKNKKAFEQDIDRKEIPKARRTDGKFSIALLDIDHFKKFNDTYGHLVGDQVLKFLADIMRKILRGGIDEAYRWGGEEFVMLYSDTDKAGAKAAAERLRKKVQTQSRKEMTLINEIHPVPAGKRREQITISIGVATFPDDGLTRKELYDKADKALYYSKETGRNKVTAAGEHRLLEKKEDIVDV